MSERPSGRLRERVIDKVKERASDRERYTERETVSEERQGQAE